MSAGRIDRGSAPDKMTAPGHEPSLWTRIDAVLARMGDHLNPILVKEARQALKSRQFLLTFSLMLIGGWGWSILSVGWNVGSFDVYRNASLVFMGYFVILAIPALVIVPFAAFQSLASERSEGTFELLWISSLSARRIVMGKLASSALQATVLFSALAPCIAFTYLLRGLDIATIGLTLAYTILIGLFASCFALMLATVTRVTQWNVLNSAMLVFGLIIGTWIWIFTVAEMFLQEGIPVDEPVFWAVNACIVSSMISFMVLFVAAAAAQMSFAADNHSTRLRVIMLAQQGLFVGWVVGLSQAQGRLSTDDISFLFSIAALYWAGFGALLTGELAELSPRAKRGLPRTALGRVFCTWFNPGSGTGYVFALTNLAACMVVLVFASVVSNGGSTTGTASPAEVGFVLWGYVAFYLGLGRLLIQALRKRFRFGPLIGGLIQVLLALAGVLIPMISQAAMYWILSDDYTLLQLPNWIWTVIELYDQRNSFGTISTVVVIVPIAGLAMFVLNLGSAAREVAQTRVATPHRVIDDSQSS